MKFKKIILLAAVMGTLSSSVLYAEEKLPKDKPGTAVFVMSIKDNNRIMVTTEFIKEDTEHLQVDLKIPIMESFKNKWFQKKLNKQISKNQLCLKKGIEKDAIKNYQYATKKGYPVFPYELLSNYHVKSNNDLFSLEVSVYDYRGGAHGMTTNTYYNVDVNKSKLLSLNDYLKMCADNKDIIREKKLINKQINKQIEERKKQGETFFDGDQGFQGVTENQSFYITKEGQLVIVFGLYEIAPYVAGIIEFPIPQKIIKCYD